MGTRVSRRAVHILGIQLVTITLLTMAALMVVATRALASAVVMPIGALAISYSSTMNMPMGVAIQGRMAR